MTTPETQVVQEALRRGHLTSVRRRVTIFIGVALTGVLVALTSSFLLYQNIQANEAQLGTLASQQAQAAQAAQALQGQVKALGATPVVTAPTTVATPSQQTIAPTVSNQQVEVAVAAYLATHPAASASQIASAIYAYCGQADLPCKGSTGATGATGVQGSTGSAGATGSTGASGADATDAQVLSAVNAYCSAHNSCSGPAGAPGATGAKGDTGATGADGTDGKPPAAWSWRDELGVMHTCTRSNSDDSAPAYSCS
jgi:hypothetical protein